MRNLYPVIVGWNWAPHFNGWTSIYFWIGNRGRAVGKLTNFELKRGPGWVLRRFNIISHVLVPLATI
jgi:hypothetical protein